ncbi:MAG TPA: type VI secretion system tip protein TssI/VgrG [Aliidongia sp.]|nr:type VI secretion system tip protein TssI/VgrG [Aliidongia sp.]
MSDNRLIDLKSTLDATKVTLVGMSGSERLNELFEYRLDLRYATNDLDIVTVLGTHMSVTLDLNEDASKQRFFDGLVTQFAYEGMDAKLARFTATIRPWLWLLTRRRNCKIFQNKTALDIIKAVFADYPAASFQDNTTAPTGGWVTRDYCVQYNESDFAFVSRLMEEEGIFYFFKHQLDQHQLILANQLSSLSTVDGFDELEFEPDQTKNRILNDVVLDWRVSTEIETDKVTLTDYNFETPTANLQKIEQLSQRSDSMTLEVYEYPGRYMTAAPGGDVAKARMEELGSPFKRVHGSGSARSLTAGTLFTLKNSERQDQDAKYAVTGTDLTVRREWGDASAADMLFECFFEALPSTAPFRPRRITARPYLPGPQTALVVGASGAEIDTDKYGRIKVQFYWDRLGTKDESSSCWIRVAQKLAGPNFGTMFIPRVGQEVVVEFLEGDPDRPLVTGVVYNATNMPPDALPDNKTRTIMRTRSSTGGDATKFNEFTFEDKAGSEYIFLHAQKDFNGEVLNNYSMKVTKDMTEEVLEGNRALTVDKGNDTVTISQGNQAVTVSQGNQTIDISQGKMTVTAMSDIAITSQSKITLTVGGSSITIEPTAISVKAMNITVAGDLGATVSGVNTKVSGDAMLTLQGGLTKIN